MEHPMHRHCSFCAETSVWPSPTLLFRLRPFSRFHAGASSWRPDAFLFDSLRRILKTEFREFGLKLVNVFFYGHGGDTYELEENR